MKPSFTYCEMCQLIRNVTCELDIRMIKYILQDEARRYTLNEFHSLIRQLQIAEINLSFQ